MYVMDRYHGWATWVSLLRISPVIKSFHLAHAILMFMLVFCLCVTFCLQAFSISLAVQVLIIPLSLLVKHNSKCVLWSEFGFPSVLAAYLQSWQPVRVKILSVV